MASKNRFWLLFCLVVPGLAGCQPVQDDSVYQENNLKIGGYLFPCAKGKRVVQYGSAVPDGDFRQNPELLLIQPGIVKVVDDDLASVYYWQNPKICPHCAVLSPNGDFLAVGTSSVKISVTERLPGSFFVVDLATKKKIFETSDCHSCPAVAFSADGKKLVYVLGDFSGGNHVHLVDFPSMKQVRNNTFPKLHITRLAFAAADSRIVACGFRGLVKVLNSSTLAPTGTVDLGEECHGDMQELPLLNLVLIQGNSKFHLIDPLKAEVDSALEPYTGSVSRFTVVPGTNLLICTGSDRVKNTDKKLRRSGLRVWDLSTKKLLNEMEYAIGSFAALPDGKRIIYQDDNWQLRIREASDFLKKSAPNP